MTQTLVREIKTFEDFCELVKEVNTKLERVIVRLEDDQWVEITPHKLAKPGKTRFKRVAEEDHLEAVGTMEKIQARLDKTEPYYKTFEEAMEHARRRGYSAH
jgi:hypothetical protein